MSNYLEQFKTLVRELDEHPKVFIHSFKTFPPVDTYTLETIQKKLSHTLSKDLTAFFLETNGLQLAWEFCVYKPKRVNSKLNFTVIDNLNGFIQIPSIEEIFNHPKMLLDDYHSDEIIYLKKINNTYQVCLNTTYGKDFFIDFPTYLKNTTHSKGLVDERQQVFSSSNYTNVPVDFENTAIYSLFNQSNHKGADTSKLQTALMLQHASQSKTISQQELDAIEEAHHQFLANGGAGGRWTTYEVGGFVFGIYLGQSSKEGIQANLEKRNLSSSSLDTCELQLPFATFCGVYGKYQDFSDSDLSYSLFTDSNLEKAIFADANLMHSDFSRTNLRNVSFMNANLTGCDFENCDLTGADFRGATWKGAKFPGAILRNIKY